MRVSKEIEFDSAHRLVHHKGKCGNLHGHRYRLILEWQGTVDSQTGMIEDFSTLAGPFRKWIDDNFDHATIANPTDLPLLEYLAIAKSRHFEMPLDLSEPTAENMVEFLHRKWTELQGDTYSCWLARIRLYETPTCYAEWRSEE